MDGRREFRECTKQEAHDLGWVYALADSDHRLLRVTVVETLDLIGDEDYGGPALFVTNIVCFKGFHTYPPFWYQETARRDPPEEQVAPPKKAKKK